MGMKNKNYPLLKKYPKVSIVIAVYNDGQILQETLKHLLNLKYPNFEILIVYSEKSTDNTIEVATKMAAQYEFIRAIPENISAANAKNIGFKNASADYVLVLDSDTFIEDGFLEKGIAAMEYDDKIALIQARTIGLNVTQNMITRTLWCLNIFDIFFRNGLNKVFKNPCYKGFGAIWRRKVVLEAGMFSLNELIEDYEFNCRLMAHYPNWKALFFNDYNVYEYYPVTLKDLFNQQIRWARGNIALNAKYFFRQKRTNFRYRMAFTYYFISVVIFPVIAFFSMGLYIIQFFLSFIFIRTSAVSLGNFLIIFSLIAIILTFVAYLRYAYSAYSKILPKKEILFGVIIILLFVGLILGVININAIWRNIKREKKTFIKVSKDEVLVK
ncbi:MAG: glycosyltransferase [Candidatus Helarchaeota archaeon]